MFKVTRAPAVVKEHGSDVTVPVALSCTERTIIFAASGLYGAAIPVNSVVPFVMLKLAGIATDIWTNMRFARLKGNKNADPVHPAGTGATTVAAGSFTA